MNKKEWSTVQIARPVTRVFVPDKCKFKSWEDVLDYLIALGVSVKVEDGISIDGVDLETIKKYSK